MLLHPANFGSDQSLHISKARAIENAMTIVTCNRIGSDQTSELTGYYCGKSQVCLPSGELLVECDDTVTATTIDLNINKTQLKKVIGVDLLSEINATTSFLKG